MTPATETLAVAGLWVIAACLVATSQPLIAFANGVGFDGQHYYAMASQLLGAHRPEAVAPFAYRVGTPLLASFVSRLTDWPLVAAFRTVNLAASLATTLLLMHWMRRHVSRGPGRWLALIFFLCTPYGPLRFSVFYPVLTDPLATLFIVAGFDVTDWVRDRPMVSRAAWLAGLVILGVLVREVALVVALAFVVTPFERSESLWVGRWIPLAGGLLALLLVRAWPVEVPSSYSFWDGVQYWMRWKTPAQMTLAPLLVFGPLLTLPLYFWRTTAGLLAERPDWLAAVMCVGVLAWIGGSDTERILVFASPVIWLLIADALNRIEPAQVRWLALAVILELLSLRIFVAIDGRSFTTPGLSWLSKYDSFWSFSVTRAELRTLAAWYAGAAVVLLTSLWWLDRSSTRPNEQWLTTTRRSRAARPAHTGSGPKGSAP